MLSHLARVTSHPAAGALVYACGEMVIALHVAWLLLSPSPPAESALTSCPNRLPAPLQAVGVGASGHVAAAGRRAALRTTCQALQAADYSVCRLAARQRSWGCGGGVAGAEAMNASLQLEEVHAGASYARSRSKLHPRPRAAPHRSSTSACVRAT